MHLELLFKHNNVKSRIKVAVGVDNVQLAPVLSDFPATSQDKILCTLFQIKDWNRFQNIAIISVIPDIVKAGYRGYQYGENTGNILVIPDISARGKKRQPPFFCF